ncbi:putative spermidine/putrescine transport system permease protein [Rhizobium subbaraonis]|uniref:Putative spermidine/putrescine transport system permease protein n=1 Tax=Rhizobium subbaraonis TaxID=908946 RepID=A0A285U1U2_9HYPH|nr:ABC transporter permease [Rhizobium subbaraonis]SOC35677.1 putative spermidine/putrescine transport system permease protein [Rhizobium subbaraonis]
MIIRMIALTTLAYLVLPLVVVIGVSLTETKFLVFPPQGLTLSWYRVILEDPTYVRSFLVSAVLAALATLAAIVVALPAAIAMARYSFRGKAALSALLLSPLVLPHIVIGAALLQYGASIGLVRNFPALLVGHLVIVTPFVLRTLMPLFSPEQLSLEEASRDLGASAWATFFLVTLPQIRAGLVSGAIFAFITSFINVELSIFNTTSTLNTIPVQLFNYVQYSVDPSIAAVSSLTILAAAIAIILIDWLIGLDFLSGR